MRIQILLWVALAFLMTSSSAPASSADRLAVLTTIPDLADIAREIGGDRVDVKSLAKGTENLHRLAVRPSHLIAMSRAELFLEMGLSLEHAFVPGLLEAARNSKIWPGEPGFVNVSVGFDPIDVPDVVDRGQSADVHPEGNPHFNLSPAAGRHMAQVVLDALIRVDEAGEEVYRANHAAYLERLTEAEARWAKIGERLAGKRVVVYHSEFDYLTRAYGVESVGTVEPQPGVSPTPAHLARLITSIEELEVGALLTARWSNDKHVRFVAGRTGVEVLELPTMVGGSKRATSWIALMDELHARVGAALAPESEPAR